MFKRRHVWLTALLILVLALFMFGLFGHAALAQGGDDNPETLAEQAAALAAEQNAAPPAVPPGFVPAVTFPLLAGVDDVNIGGWEIDPVTNAFLNLFTGFQVWGMAYDPVNALVYFNNGTTLYSWPAAGGPVTTLGTITDPGGAAQSMVSLAFYNGILYGTKNIANEAVYIIDTTTRIATVYIDYVDADYDFGGLAADPLTGELYGTNDDTTPHGSGLFRINLDGTATLITPYPAGETDIDGLAIGDNGRAYLIEDEPGASIHVYDLIGGTYLAPLNTPWATAEVFSAGTWVPQGDFAAIGLNKTVGTDPNVCAATDEITVPAGTEVTYCYEVTNTGTITLTLHDLDDSELGMILNDFAYDLLPGATAFLTQTATINVTTVNTATWTAFNPAPPPQLMGGESATASDTATVNIPAAAPNIDVDPLSMSSTQPPNTTTVQQLTIDNTGDADLVWNIFEEPAAAPPGPAAPPSNLGPTAEPVVRSEDDCAQFENYAGREPEGYAQYCVQDVPQPWVSDNFDPTDTAYAQDIGFVSDNFVSHVLNDFPGQTVIGPNARPFFAMDFDETATTLYAIDNTTRELGTYNLATGAFTPIAVVTGIPAADNISGLTIDPRTGVAYVSGVQAAGMTLYTMNLATAVATPIGSDPTVPLMIDIAIGPQGIMYGHEIGTDMIYTIDTSTGAATAVGPTGVNSNFAQGMDFDNIDGTLYAYTYQGGGANVYGTIDLATGALTPLASSNPQGEFEGATQTVGLFVCDTPADIPWVSVNPTNGTTAPAASTTVDVTFDSTGLAVGTYLANLCIESNDPDPGPGNETELVVVPVELTVAAEPAISLAKTVGLDPATCAPTNGITIPAGYGGTVVYYCYEVTNTGTVTLTLHDLNDSELGNIFTALPYDLAPGASVDTVAAGLEISATITQTTVNTATWVAYAPNVPPVTAVASATVTRGDPTGVSLSNFGPTVAAAAPLWLAGLLVLLLAGGALILRRKTAA
jgi:hypothetical protein